MLKIIKLSLKDLIDGNIVLRGITTDQLNKLHVVYGAWLREKMGTLELKMHAGHMEYVALHETAGGNV